MKICPSLRVEYVPFVWSFLLIIPLNRPAQAIDSELGLQIWPELKVLTLFFQDLFDIAQVQFDTDDEFLVVLEEQVDVLSAIKASVKKDTYLFVSHDIEFSHELFHCFHVGDIAREFPVIKGKSRLFTEEKGEVDLR